MVNFEGKYFEVSGEVSGLLVTYFVAAVENGDTYYDLTGWTLTSYVEDNRSEIIDVLSSFSVE
jgi:hypothetical protein